MRLVKESSPRAQDEGQYCCNFLALTDCSRQRATLSPLMWPGTTTNCEEELTASGSSNPSPHNRTMTVIMSASMRESGQLSRIMYTTRLRLKRISCRRCTDEAPAAVAAPAASLGFLEACTSPPTVGSMCRIRRLRTVRVPLGDLGPQLAQSWNALMGYTTASQSHICSDW